MNIICDMYPYIATSNPLSSELPSWIHEGGIEKLIEKPKDRSIREKLKNDLSSYRIHGNSYKSLQLI